MRYALSFVFLALVPAAAFADVVNVYEETECADETVRIAERALETGRKYETGAAPAKSGWVFTHWTISTTQDFADRDEWGRSLDVASFDLYENTTLTAHYLPAGQDADGDGVADGFEIYWYGDLSQGAASDTDGDGWTFAEELSRGTNPIMSETADAGPVAWVAGSEWLFNPNDYGAVTIRSEPEGLLFATSSEVCRPGTKRTTRTKWTLDLGTTTFAYWSFNGVRQADEWGRAVDAMEFVTDGSPLTIVAYAAGDYETRMKLYWYGTTDVAMTSDTDGDGKTFAEELAAGTNPLMAETKDEGPVMFIDTETTEFNLQPYEQVNGGVIDDRYVLFESLGGSNLQPVVADVNGDGLWDLVLVFEGGARVFVNVGGEENPEFEELGKKDGNDGKDEKDAAELLAESGVDLAMNSTEKLATMALDVAPVGALSATVWGETLLVSDDEGRIWYYRGIKDESTQLLNPSTCL